MAWSYEQTLDACIDLLMQGDSIESCLARYQPFAEQLRYDLALVQGSIAAFQFTPSAESKQRGLERLQQELRLLEAATATPAPSLFARFSTWISTFAGTGGRKWATAAAAVIVLMFFSTVGLVAASGDALPGSFLYSVKRTTEEAQIAFARSDFNRAKRQLELAEVRAAELAAIGNNASRDRILATSNQLVDHIADATRIISSIESDSRANQLSDRLNAGASRSLALIQQELAFAPGEKGLTAAIEVSGRAYGEAIETAADRSEQLYVAGRPGQLQVQATDPPPDGVDRLLLEITEIEAFLAAGEKSEWVALLDSAITIDLIRAAATPQLLIQAQQASGAYSRLRISFGEATVVISGVSKPAAVPESVIEFRRPFRLLEDELTTVTVDFDGAASLITQPTGDFTLNVVAALLANEPPAALSTDRAKLSTTTFAGPTPTQRTVELTGKIEITGSDSITVNGITVELDSETLVSGDVQSGSEVTVDAELSTDGSLVASLISVVDIAGNRSPAVNVEDDQQIDVAIEGALTAINGSEWTVSGRKVRVSDQTKKSPGVSIGSNVRVVGTLSTDNTVVAVDISVIRGPGPSPTTTPQATPKQVPGVPTSTVIPPAVVPTPGAINVDFTGRITAVSGVTWEVGGRSVLITTSTLINGIALIGKSVSVQGILTNGGQVIAQHVTILSVATPGPVPITPTPALPTSGPTITPPVVIPTVGIIATPTPLPVPTTGPVLTPTPIILVPTLLPTVSGTTIPPVATPTPVPTLIPPPTPASTPAPTATPETVVIEGIVTLVTGDQLVVSGTTIVITSGTSVSGLIAPGVTVRVTGTLQPNGSVLATSVTVL